MSTHPVLRRWLRRIGIVLGVLVVVVGACLWWLLGTQTGLNFVLARVTAASGGTLAIGHARGTLAGPFELTDITYRDVHNGTQARIGRVKADPAVWSLLAGRVRLADLDVDGVKVALTSTKNPRPAASNALSLQPPVNIVLDRVRIDHVAVSRDGKPLFAADTLQLAGVWTTHALAIRTFALRAPAGHADLSGRVTLGGRTHGDGRGNFEWTLDGTTWAGTLDARSDGHQATLALALRQPLVATLRVTLQQQDALPWTAQLEAPAFDTQPILGPSSIKTIALALAGHGDRHGATLTGHVDLNQQRIELQPLALHYDPAARRVTIDRLALASPRINGTLTARGTIDLAPEPVRADLAIQWRDVLIPKDIAGQALASTGDLTVAGSVDAYRVAGRLSVGPPGQPAQLALELTGTPTRIMLDHLTVTQPAGNLATSGSVTLEPHVGWNLAVTGRRFNPGLLLAGWPGALDIDLVTQGHLTSGGPDVTLALNRLAGKLRERNLSGKGTLHITPQRVISGQLALASGHSRITLDATGTRTNRLDLDLAIMSLGDWLPDASGALRGQVKVDGLWPRLAVRANLHGQKLAVGENRVATLALDAHVPDLSQPGGRLDVTADDLDVVGMTFKTLTLTGQGNAAQHTLQLHATGEPLSLQLALTGQLNGRAWNGTLSRLDVDLHSMPPWHLQQPGQLAWNRGDASLTQTCLTAGTPVLCVSARMARDGSARASYRLEQLPLALVTALADSGLPLASEGFINGSGELTRSAAGALDGHATLASASGAIGYPDHPELPLLAWTNLTAEATFTPRGQHVVLAATFDHGGHLAGTVDVTGAEQALSGNVSMRLDSLAPVELFTSSLANVTGHLDAALQLGGTLAQPVVDGQASLAQFGAEVPAVGLKLRDGNIHVTTTDARQWRIDGQVASGKGTLQVAGTLGLGTNATTHLAIRGEKVLAADIPAAEVTVSPDLMIEHDNAGLAITGTLTVDTARVELEKLPGAGATQASPDVVVVDAAKPPAENTVLPIRASVTVDLGHQAHLIGYGLDGRVGGRLAVSQSPGKATTARGQIVINGTYRAYGQDLVIKQGHLLFAGTPIDNPGLDIRAIRALHPNATISDDQVVGLQITGTAQRPVMTVFSNPAMEQSDALSYLITGKPLSAVRGGEGNMVDAAAQALGSAAGDLLAKSIGTRLGIEAGVSSSAALGTAAFTVGKYLSPRLYVSYGVGLFDPGQVITLRYVLSRRWNFEAEQATEFSRASLNYRFER